MQSTKKDTGSAESNGTVRLRRLGFESNLVTDGLTKLFASFFCNTFSDTDSCDSSWLRTDDVAFGTFALQDVIVEQDLRDLSCFTRTGSSHADGDLVELDFDEHVGLLLGDWQTKTLIAHFGHGIIRIVVCQRHFKLFTLALKRVFSGAKLLVETTCALLSRLSLFGELSVGIGGGSIGIFAGRSDTGSAGTFGIDFAADHCIVNVLNRVVEFFAHVESDVRSLVDGHAWFVKETECLPQGRIGRLDVRN